MTALDLSALIDCLRRYRLLEPAQLVEVTDRLHRRFPEAKDLARELLQRGWLTAYQVNQLFAGRGGDLLLGSYVLLERLGEGGMGQVFKARHQNLGRVVAVKLIRKERLADASAVRRFEREIRAVAHVNHPNIVRAFDADECDGSHLLVMEYVEGGCDLARLVKLRGPLPVAEACAFIRQAAVGLQHAHERGLVHRDIKPHNLLLGADGKTVKILDMGLARVQQPDMDPDNSSALTQEGALMGTPDYIAPEQALSSHDADIRADIYSLGGTLYYLLTGKVPFPGGSLMEKLLKHQTDEPHPVESLRPDVPPAVAALVRRMMAKRPLDRFQTPAALASALADPASALPFGAGSPSAGSSRGVQTVPLAERAPAAPQQWGEMFSPAGSSLGVAVAARPAQPPRDQRRKLYWIAGGSGAGLLLLILVLVPWRAGPHTSGGPPGPGRPVKLRATEPAGSEEEAGKTGLDEEGFITTWLLLAPIPLEPGQSAADALASEQVKDEAKLQPKAGDKVQVRGQELVWGKYTTVDYYFNFNHFLDKQTDDSVGFAACYIHAAAEMKNLKLKTGSDDQALVYLNGAQVLKQPLARALAKDQDSMDVTLHKGVNVLVFKVINQKFEWVGCARFLDKDGQVVRNVSVSLSPK